MRRNCGGQFTGAEGTFSSPNYPSNYTPLSQCTWNISVDPAFVIQLDIYNINIESSDNCMYDSLQVTWKNKYKNSSKEQKNRSFWACLWYIMVMISDCLCYMVAIFSICICCMIAIFSTCLCYIIAIFTDCLCYMLVKFSDFLFYMMAMFYTYISYLIVMFSNCLCYMVATFNCNMMQCFIRVFVTWSQCLYVSMLHDSNF